MMRALYVLRYAKRYVLGRSDVSMELAGRQVDAGRQAGRFCNLVTIAVRQALIL